MDRAEIMNRRQKREIDSKRDGDYRNEYERDYGRVIHSPVFRRLQGKSQIFGAGSGDYYRTRLTHSLEVAQIARFLAARLVKDYPGHSLDIADEPWKVIDPLVVECAALAHDLGHPPFGHTGEDELDSILKQFGLRFEGNAQNFHIMMFLEKRTEVFDARGSAEPTNGLNLTTAVLLATNKYPYLLQMEPKSAVETAPFVNYKKGLYKSEWDYIADLRSQWGMANGQLTLEAQLMDLCDDIAYSTHDLDDGIRAGKFDPDVLDPGHHRYRALKDLIMSDFHDPAELWADGNLEDSIDSTLEAYYKGWKDCLQASGRDVSRARRELKGIWIGVFTQKVGILPDKVTGRERIAFAKGSEEDRKTHQQMVILKNLAWNLMVKDFRIQRHQRRSRYVIGKLWDALGTESSGRNILPPDWISRYDYLKKNTSKYRGPWSWERFAADYIAGCTDAYAETLFGELFGGRFGSIYDRD